MWPTSQLYFETFQIKQNVLRTVSATTVHLGRTNAKGGYQFGRMIGVSRFQLMIITCFKDYITINEGYALVSQLLISMCFIFHTYLL